MPSFKVVTHERFIDQLEILPPAYQNGKGFLMGEPFNHRTCAVCRRYLPTYTAFISYRDCFYESDEPMTVAEFMVFDTRSLSS
jgi:hypothetical protein